MIEQRWGSAPPWWIGVEEELLLVEPETFAPGLGAGELVAGRSPRLKTELFECVVETTTEPCADADAALEQLVALRREVGERASARGLVVAAAGSHPIARAEEQPIVQHKRYERIVSELGDVARRQLVCGLHVHVSMPDAATCLRALEGMLPHLPGLLGAAANSPYLDGEETGFRTARAQRLGELPFSGAPPPFPTWDAWEDFHARADRDYTLFWWDIRPHPRLGTLEVRMPDQQTDVRRSAELAEQIQRLVREAAENDHEPYDRERYASERVQAAAGLLGDGPEAERQLEVGRSHGLVAVCADLVARSLP